MKNLFKIVKKILVSIGHYMGLFWTKIILGVFYITFFSLAAIIMKIIGTDHLGMRSHKKSTWRTWEHVGRKEEWYRPF